ncbi:MAG: hypothetical protein H6736_11200 [Alphaproteobacteria bacterium]|nr:hypothetical protein [Alphaproteobacteria bacterium]
MPFLDDGVLVLTEEELDEEPREPASGWSTFSWHDGEYVLERLGEARVSDLPRSMQKRVDRILIPVRFASVDQLSPSDLRPPTEPALPEAADTPELRWCARRELDGMKRGKPFFDAMAAVIAALPADQRAVLRHRAVDDSFDGTLAAAAELGLDPEAAMAVQRALFAALTAAATVWSAR